MLRNANWSHLFEAWLSGTRIKTFLLYTASLPVQFSTGTIKIALSLKLCQLITVFACSLHGKRWHEHVTGIMKHSCSAKRGEDKSNCTERALARTGSVPTKMATQDSRATCCQVKTIAADIYVAHVMQFKLIQDRFQEGQFNACNQ